MKDMQKLSMMVITLAMVVVGDRMEEADKVEVMTDKYDDENDYVINATEDKAINQGELSKLLLQCWGI